MLSNTIDFLFIPPPIAVTLEQAKAHHKAISQGSLLLMGAAESIIYIFHIHLIMQGDLGRNYACSWHGVNLAEAPIAQQFMVTAAGDAALQFSNILLRDTLNC